MRDRRNAEYRRCRQALNLKTDNLKPIKQYTEVLQQRIKKIEEYKSKTLLVLKESQGEVKIKLNIANHFLYKLIDHLTQVIKFWDNLTLQTSIVRFTLEQLIISRLLLKESNYYLKLYYSLYNHQEDKIKIIISRLKEEIDLLEALELKENDLFKNLSNAELKNGGIKAAMDLMDEETKNTVNHFLENVEHLGFGFLRHLLETKTLPVLELKLIDTIKQKDEKAKKLVKQRFFRKEFSTHHASQVFNLLRDSRTWEMKAYDADLSNEYKNVYNMTSSLIHCTSYSIFTEFEIKEEEIRMNYNYLDQYSSKIFNNIKMMVESAR